MGWDIYEGFIRKFNKEDEFYERMSDILNTPNSSKNKKKALLLKNKVLAILSLFRFHTEDKFLSI